VASRGRPGRSQGVQHREAADVDEHRYQVIVRGQFDGLDDDVRAALLAAVAEHDVLSARFTEDGTVTYDRSLHRFTFRCVIRAEDNGEEEAALFGEEKAVTVLRAMGCGVRNLTAVATDMDKVVIRRR
jgi:hypothetical protein